MKVLLRIPLNPYSGYGLDGIGIVRAMLARGLDVFVQPTHVTPPLPADVANLLTRPLEAPFDLLLHHVDPGQLGLSPEARRAATVTAAWTMWEYSTLDNLPTQQRRKLRKALADYDAVFAYDMVSAGALTPYLDPARLAVVQGGFLPQEWPNVERDWHSARFGFVMEGALHERKDPFVAIQAFKELKEELPEEFEGAELHLKVNTPGLHQAMEQWVPKLRVHYAVWPLHTLREFYAAQHVLLAPSRGEGKNMPALQFMSTGGVVVATAWGGHRQWLSSEYAYPLDFTLAPVSPATPKCLNARASKEHLKAIMLHLYRNRGDAARKGALAGQIIPTMCSWTAATDRFFLRLADLIPGAGGRLLDASRRPPTPHRAAPAVEPVNA